MFTVVHLVHSLDGGGTERTLIRLLHRLRTSDTRHIVITQRAKGSLAATLPSDVPCVALEMTGRARMAGIRLARVVRTLGPCLVHARNTGTWADAVLARATCRNARLVLGFHGLESNGRFTMRDRVVTEIALRLGADFTTVCRSGADKLTDELRIPRERISILANGVDLDRFSPPTDHTRAAARAELGIPHRSVVYGTVGSLTPVKRTDLLLTAFARSRSSRRERRLLLVGDGPDRSALETLGRSLGCAADITFTGARSDVPGLLPAMDVFVNTSDSEGMSNAVLEAMAMGLPILATRVGGNEELVRDGVEGWLVRRDDVASLAAAMNEAADPRDARTRMGIAARVRAESFSFESTVRAYSQFYQDRAATLSERRAVPEFCG